MNIKEKSIITLKDNKKYIVVKKVKNKGKYYYFALNINDTNDYKFFYTKENDLIEILDDETIANLIILFKINIIEDLNI